MKITETKEGDVLILSFHGKLTIGVGDVALRDAVRDAVERGDRKIVLDLSDLSTMDSSGIGELVSAFTVLNNYGGQLRLLNLPPKVSDILQITQLISVFEVYDDEAEAIASF